MLRKITSIFTGITVICWLSGLALLVPLPVHAVINEGDLIRGPDGIKVYIVNADGYKRHIFNPDVFDMYGHFTWESIQEVDQAVLDSYTTSDLYRVDVEYQVYSVGEDGIKHWLNMTAAEFATEGYSWNQVFIVNAVEGAYYTVGSDLTVAEVVGELTVVLADDSPIAGTLVEAQATADLAHFIFTNSGSTEAKVTSIVFDRIGVSADATLANVYLFDGTTDYSVRLTDAGTLSESQLDFNNAAGVFTIPANSSKTIAVKSDIDETTSGQTVGVSLTSVTTDATLSATLPIAGAIHSIATATLAGVAVGPPLPDAAATTDPGTDVRVWESTFTITTRKVDFSRLALRQINSILSADINNFRLLIDGVEVDSVDNLDANGYITFTFDETLNTGNRTIKVLADVIGGSGRYIQMSLRNKADLNVEDSQYHVNISAYGTFPTSTGVITVNSGTMAVQKASDSPSGDVIDGATSVSLGKFTFAAYGESIKVETLMVDFAYDGSPGSTNNTAATLRNGRIMVDGSQVGNTTTLDSTTNSNAGTSFTVNFTVTPGSPAAVEILADIFDNDGTGVIDADDTITVTLSQGTANATLQVSLGTYGVPTTSTDGNQITIATGAVTLAAQTTYPAQSITVPQTAYKLGAWNLTGSSVEAVNVHTFSLDIDEAVIYGSTTLSTTFNESDITDFYLVYGSNTSAVKSSASAADNDWSVSFTLAKNEVMPIGLYANIGSTITASHAVVTDLGVTGTGADSTATVTQTDKAGQTITYQASSITATRDASTPDAVIVDDSGTVKTVSYKFETLYDSYTITEVVLGVTEVTAVLNVILKDGATILGTRPGAAAVTFSGLSVPVVANSTKVLDVELELSTVGVGAGTSDDDLTTDFTSAKAIAGSTGIEAGVSDSTSEGNAMRVYKAIPTITNVALPSGLLTTGTKTLAKFTIDTAGSGTIAWKYLLFTVNKSATDSTDPIIADAELYNASTGIIVAGTDTITGLDVATTSAGTIAFVATAEQQISGAKTYELRATVTGTLAVGDNVNTNITLPSSHADPVAYGSMAGGESFIWSDMSAQSHGVLTLDWLNDYLVKSLATDAQTLSK